MKNYHLIGLDVDRTLVKDSQGTDLNLELVKKLQTFSERIQVALITNQGGPACRDAGWATSEKYPGFREVQTRMEQIATTLQQTIGRQVRLYICYAFMSKQGEILLPAALKDQLHRIDWASWRLPGPGMLLQAQYDAGVKDPLRCLFVGDEEKSQQRPKLHAGTFSEAAILLSPTPSGLNWPGSECRRRPNSTPIDKS